MSEEKFFLKNIKLSVDFVVIFRKCLNSEDLHPVLLWFKDKNREDSYRNKTDNEFHHYLSFTIVLFVGMTLIQILLDHT